MIVREGKEGKRGVGIWEVESIGSSTSCFLSGTTMGSTEYPEEEPTEYSSNRESSRALLLEEMAGEESYIKPRGSIVSLISLATLARRELLPFMVKEKSPSSVPSLKGLGIGGKEKASLCPRSEEVEKAEEKDDL